MASLFHRSRWSLPALATRLASSAARLTKGIEGILRGRKNPVKMGKKSPPTLRRAAWGLQTPGKECSVIITGETSDGYHTFNELYEHRFVLWMALCKAMGGSWRTRLHSDGTSYPGWFVLGLGDAKGEQITYHLPNSKWDETYFAETRERVRDFDGHTSPEVVQRIREQFVLASDPSMSDRSEKYADNRLAEAIATREVAK